MVQNIVNERQRMQQQECQLLVLELLLLELQPFICVYRYGSFHTTFQASKVEILALTRASRAPVKAFFRTRVEYVYMAPFRDWPSCMITVANTFAVTWPLQGRSILNSKPVRLGQ